MTTLQIATAVALRTAREYLRVSKGRGRSARSITDQHADNLAAEQDHGPWTWGEPYADTGSASKYATRGRGDFDKLMADLESGVFGEPGTVLVLWEISRLSREMAVGNRMVKLCELGGYLIHITSEEHTYNPQNYADYHALNAGINDAEKEARRLSARTLRGVNSAAREGRPHGRVPLGYARDYEVIDARPRCVRQYPDAVWGPRILSLFERVAGDAETLPEPIHAISKDWEERGWWIPEKVENGEAVPSRPFSAQHLRAFLVRPVYAGIRIFKGQELPQWEGMTPLVPRELFDRVQVVLADPTRRTYMGGGIRWALSTTLRCDVCGGPMTVKDSRSGLGYECQTAGHVWVNKDETDRAIIGDLEPTDPETGVELPPKLGVILAYLSVPQQHAALTRPAVDATGEEQAARDELARLKGELKELEDAPTPKTARARIQRTADMEELETDVSALEARLNKLTLPNPLAELLPEDPGTNIVEWWLAADIHRQRAVAAMLLTPEVLGQARIMRSPGRVAIPVMDRINWITEAAS